jgi:hypothetical protein
MKRIIQVSRVEKEVLSPEKYLNLNKKEKSNISFSEIIPARLGKSDFGKIMVHYRTPIYK